jgi:hypothetical protein
MGVHAGDGGVDCFDMPGLRITGDYGTQIIRGI